MTAHLVHLCISAAFIGVSFNEAKPIEESRLQGQHRNVRYLPRDFQNFITSHIKTAPNSREDSRAVKESLASKTNNHIFKGSSRFTTKSQKHSKKPIQDEYKLNSLQSSRSADEVGSDSSTLFIDPTDVPVQASAPPGTAPYPPALPQIRTNPELPTNGVSYSPSEREGTGGVPFVTENPAEPTNQDSSQASKEATGDYFATANSPDQDPSRSQVVYSPSGAPIPSNGQEEREFSFAPANSQEPVTQDPPKPETPLSRISYSPSGALSPPIGEQTKESSLIQYAFNTLYNNALGSPDPDRPSEDDSLSPPDPFTLPGKTSQEKKLRVFPPGLDDDNRISLRLQDEIVRSPFLPNPDFFAFSAPVEVDALGKLTGRPFSFGVGFNQEGTSIGDATYIVPDNLAKDLDFELPESKPPQETFGLTIDDGQSIRSELRKETGEFIESFSSVDGTMRSEAGTLVDTPDGGRVLVLKGFYSYQSPEGYMVKVDYTSDQKGYHATPSIIKPAPTAANR